MFLENLFIDEPQMHHSGFGTYSTASCIWVAFTGVAITPTRFTSSKISSSSTTGVASITVLKVLKVH